MNRSESRMPTLISGAVTGDAQPGDNVAVAVNGRTFTGLVVTDEHGALRYEVAVDSSVLTEGSNNVEVTVTGWIRQATPRWRCSTPRWYWTPRRPTPSALIPWQGIMS
ncbi:Ig-like domain-containing protein [Citrobacter portucalensis]